MHFRFSFVTWLCWFSLITTVGVLANANAQPTVPEKSKSAPALKLPSGAILIVTGDADALDVPQSVRLTPAKYKELTDQIETLKRQLGLGVNLFVKRQ